MPQKKLTDDPDNEMWDHAKVGHPTAVWFICPVCDSGHAIAVAFEPPAMGTNPIWKKTAGSTLEDITLNPSINCDVMVDVKNPDGTITKVRSSCRFHGWIKNGYIVW